MKKYGAEELNARKIKNFLEVLNIEMNMTKNELK